VRIIDQRAVTGLTVGDLVETLAVSRRWLELAFREHLGRSPNQEIQRVRLLRARRLLELTNISISQVAEAVGFAEVSGLTHFFERLTSYTPRDYRAWARGCGCGAGRAWDNTEKSDRFCASEQDTPGALG